MTVFFMNPANTTRNPRAPVTRPMRFISPSFVTLTSSKLELIEVVIKMVFAPIDPSLSNTKQYGPDLEIGAWKVPFDTS